MSRVSRADWAASVPWAGIMGKPSSFGATDISQLAAAGFSSGQVPRWNGSKFVPYTIPSPSPTPPSPVSPVIIQEQFVWDVPNILPLQTAYEDFPLIGALPSQPCIPGVNFDLQFCLPFSFIIANDTIRLMVLNMNSVAVDLGSSTWNVCRFP